MALTKNNPALKGKKQQDKTYEGKTVKPSLYVGTWVGHGKYMAATQEDGKFVIFQAFDNSATLNSVANT